jgi:hypothetical protein
MSANVERTRESAHSPETANDEPRFENDSHLLGKEYNWRGNRSILL